MSVAKVGIQFSPPQPHSRSQTDHLSGFQYILEVMYWYAPDEVWGRTSLWFLCCAGTFLATSDYKKEKNTNDQYKYTLLVLLLSS